MVLEEALLSFPVSHWQVDQVVAFDWNDGPRQGIAAMSYPHCEVVFDLLAERFNPDGLDDCLFRLRELPPGSMQSVLGIISSLGEPLAPLWVPVWQFPNEEERQKADQAIDQVLTTARRTPIIVLTQDMIHFAGVWSAQGDLADRSDWFSSLGIS